MGATNHDVSSCYRRGRGVVEVHSDSRANTLVARDIDQQMERDSIAK